jgi:hypothetical protein
MKKFHLAVQARLLEKAVSEKEIKEAKQGPIECWCFFNQPVRPHKEKASK